MSIDMELEPNRTFRGINVAVLNDGREIHVDDINDLSEGKAILDEIEDAIIRIESQLFGGDGDPEWRKRATFALKRKRAILSRLQRRVSELRRSAHVQVSDGIIDAKRGAFLRAAQELLGHEICVELWARAQELEPALFAENARVTA